MINDPELKAMSDVYDALKGLDADTQRRVTDWVMGKLKSGSSSAGAKRGRKPGKKRGRPAGATAAKKAGKRGRPGGTGKKSTTAKRGRGRPRKVVAVSAA